MLFFIVLLSYFDSSNLARDGLWQFIYELDDARILIRGSLVLYVILQLLDQVGTCQTLVLIFEHNSSLYHHTSYRVWYTGNGTLYYGRMSHQGILYLEGTNAIA